MVRLTLVLLSALGHGAPAPAPAVPDSGRLVVAPRAAPATAGEAARRFAPGAPGMLPGPAADPAGGAPVGPYVLSRFARPLPADTPVRRPRPIEYSDAYYTRLTIHRVASYAILPLFAGEYVVGQRLLKQEPQPGGLKAAHGVLAAGIYGLFTVNTVTGVWNLWAARKDPHGRPRKMLHGILMLAADAGFAATAATTPHEHEAFEGGFGSARSFDTSRANTHRAVAIGSIGAATVGTLMMWLWKN
jgi:hypothetical protein